MKYENKRNGKVVELVSQNDRYKTVMLEEVETGRAFPVTTSTFKRWYKKLAEPVAEPVEEVVKLVLKDTDVMVDCAQEPEQVEEQLATDAEWEPGMEPAAPDREYYRPAAERYLAALGYECKFDKSMPHRLIVRQGGKTFAEVYFGANAFKINVRKERAEEIEALARAYNDPTKRDEYSDPRNCYFKVIRNYYLPVTLGNIPYTNTAVMLDVFPA